MQNGKSIPKNTGIPAGLTMALSQNLYALNHFASLPNDEKEAIISRARTIGSQEEMQSMVNNMIRH